MPLIRLFSHPRNNKWSVDKLIFIDGLPEDMLYYEREGKKYLKDPWERDVTENIPEYIREGLNLEPFNIRVFTPPTEKGLPPLDEEFEVWGLRLDYQNPRGEEVWRKIERIIDRETPRGEDLPEPVIVNPSIDNDHRMHDFSIRAEDIPIVHLHNPKLVVPEPKEMPKVQSLNCPVCQKTFNKPQAFRMHKIRTGHTRVPVEA